MARIARDWPLTIVPIRARCENDELGRILGLIREVHGNKGIYVYDRGGDSIELFRYFTGNGLRFIVRLMFARHGRWTRYAPDEPSPQLEFALDWGWRRNGGLRRERRFRHVMEEQMCALRGCAPCSRRNPERARRFDCCEAGNTRAR